MFVKNTKFNIQSFGKWTIEKALFKNGKNRDFPKISKIQTSVKKVDNLKYEVGKTLTVHSQFILFAFLNEVFDADEIFFLNVTITAGAESRDFKKPGAGQVGSAPQNGLSVQNGQRLGLLQRRANLK